MKKQQSIKETLHSAKIKNTPVRKMVLDTFLSCDFALSHNDIEKYIKDKIDKVTLYRTLKVFEEKGIIHQVHDGGSCIKYALCSHQCNSESHHDSHIHFKCYQCDHTFCIEQPIPQFTLPKGFDIRNTEILIQGTCSSCTVS